MSVADARSSLSPGKATSYPIFPRCRIASSDQSFGIPSGERGKGKDRRGKRPVTLRSKPPPSRGRADMQAFRLANRLVDSWASLIWAAWTGGYVPRTCRNPNVRPAVECDYARGTRLAVNAFTSIAPDTSRFAILSSVAVRATGPANPAGVLRSCSQGKASCTVVVQTPGTSSSVPMSLGCAGRLDQ